MNDAGAKNMNGFSFSQYKDASDFLLKHPGMSRENAVELLDRELKKMEKVT